MAILGGYRVAVMETKRTARVLIRHEMASDGTPWYVAQVLEYDLATQAKTINDLNYEIERMVVAHIVCSEQEGLDPFDVPPAPQEYVKEYEASGRDWSIDITHFKSDQPMKQALPELACRFALGL
jgi:hypothetical protein